MRNSKHIIHASAGTIHRERRISTGKCPNCDECVLLPEALNTELGVPACSICDCVLHDFANFYIRCPQCGVEFDKSLSSCPECGAGPNGI